MLIPIAAPAQGLVGVVVDSAGQPLAQADVILGENSRTRTDSLGRFRFGGADEGRYRLRVRLIGYAPYESGVTVSDLPWTKVLVTLHRTPQVLGGVRVTDTRLCVPNSLAGFECRRRSGKGMFRDAGEIRSLQPSAWTDMLDGMPGLRRDAIMTPDGIDWRPIAPPGKCLRVIYNGENPRFDGHVRRVPQENLVPDDVIAIEYYVDFKDVPEAFKRFAWPRFARSPCSLIVYWLKQPESEPVDKPSQLRDVIQRPPNYTTLNWLSRHIIQMRDI